jgi:hypothetical protein
MSKLCANIKFPGKFFSLEVFMGSAGLSPSALLCLPTVMSRDNATGPRLNADL